MPDIPAGAEPGVIDRTLLEAKAQQKPFSYLQKLSLHALNIWKIDHLWMFEQLTELKLNGNAIEKLENLEKLTNLRELNVSHNKIQKLEGLDTLTRLETLVVHHNEISRLEGLDELRELRLLSIGHNKLASRDDVLYLRRVKSLRALSLEGNPVCEIPGHEEFTSVLLPELRYLDYKLVKRPQQISIELRAVLSRVEETEAIGAETALASETEKRRFEVLKDAFVDELEVDDLVSVPGLHWTSVLEVGGEVALAMVQEHREQMQKVCTSLQQLGLHQRALRQAEEREFAACWKLACDTNRENSMRCVDNFLEPKETIYRTLRRLLRETERRRTGIGDVAAGEAAATSELENTRNIADRLTRDTELLWKSLLELELELQEQLEAIATQFNNRMTHQAEVLVTQARQFLLLARDLEEQFHSRLQEPCTLRLANMKLQRSTSQGGETLPALNQYTAQLLEEDETLGAWLREAHEARLQRIMQRETKLETSTNNWLNITRKRISQDAFNRSRARILEIINFIEMQKKEVMDLQPTSLAYMGLL